jgi:hypothetical protein
MSASPTKQEYREAGLTPFQAKLVTDMLEAPVPVRHLLIAQPGLGKSSAAMALATEIAKANSNYRILVIGPSVLTAMYEHRLSQSIPGVTVTPITRRIFREFEERADGSQPFWPTPFVAVVGMDTARQDDIRASLCSVTWDLAILEEVHLFARSRWSLLKTILTQDVFFRVLLMTATADLKGIAPLLKKVTRTEWLGRDLRNWEDKPLFPVGSPKIDVVTFRRSDSEVSLLRSVLSLTEELSRTPAGQLVKSALLRQAASSSVALELVLRRLRNALAPAASERFLTENVRSQMQPRSEGLDTDTDLDVSPITGQSQWRSRAKALASLNGVLDQLESVDKDTKREALERLLQRLVRDVGSSPTHICVVCTSKATANYLHTAVPDRGIRVWLLTGDKTLEQVNEELGGFTSGGGVLICTTPMLQGLDLRFAQAFVHYDLPGNTEDMYIRATRSPTAVNYVLVDKSGVLPEGWIGEGPRGSGSTG